MITSGMPDMGLGFEVATPDIMKRPPQSLKRGVFTLEVMMDMLVYGLWIAALCLGAFSLVLFGFGDGNLGENCNDRYSADCDTVFRARATCFACLTWFALFLAWELVDMRRSFFRMQPGSKLYFTQWQVAGILETAHERRMLIHRTGFMMFAATSSSFGPSSSASSPSFPRFTFRSSTG